MAPMEGVTNLSFRRLMRQIGGMGPSTTEFIPSSTLRTKGTKYSNRQSLIGRTADQHTDHGRDPAIMADAAGSSKTWVLTFATSIWDVRQKGLCALWGLCINKDPILAAQIVREVQCHTNTTDGRCVLDLMENEEMPLNFRKYVNLKAQRPLRFIGVQERTNTVGIAMWT